MRRMVLFKASVEALADPDRFRVCASFRASRIPPTADKFEIRSTKSETNPKHKAQRTETLPPDGRSVLKFGLGSFGIVSDFDIRASSFRQGYVARREVPMPVSFHRHNEPNRPLPGLLPAVKLASFRALAPGGCPPRSEYRVYAVLKPRLYKRSQSAVPWLSSAPGIGFVSQDSPHLTLQTGYLTLSPIGFVWQRSSPRKHGVLRPERGVGSNAWKRTTRIRADEHSPAFGRNQERLSPCRAPAEMF